MKPETIFWHYVRDNFTNIKFTRIENLSAFGTPDLLCQNNKNNTFFTLELKVTRSNSVRLSPHQISFHIRHPVNTFILVQPLAASSSKLDEIRLYRGARCLQLASSGLQLAACFSGLATVNQYLSNL